MRLPCLFVSMVLATTAPAAELVWQDVIISYDPAIWRADAPIEGGGLRLACIAPDCVGNASLFGHLRQAPPPDSAAATPRCAAMPGDYDGWRRKLPLGERSGSGLPFTAASRWSGCRAADSPILEACAVHDGLMYRLTTRLSAGCNFGPPLPEHRFIQLLDAIRPASSSAAPP